MIIKVYRLYILGYEYLGKDIVNVYKCAFLSAHADSNYTNTLHIGADTCPRPQNLTPALSLWGSADTEPCPHPSSETGLPYLPRGGHLAWAEEGADWGMCGD